MRLPAWLIAAFAIVAVLGAASALWGEGGTEAPATVCAIVELPDGPVDFTRQAPDAVLGMWVTADGTVIAWSAAEDETPWDRPECVRPWPR